MGELINNQQEGLVFIISAPAGTGKTTLVQLLTREFPNVIASVSYTTRQPREGEVNGTHYHFVTRDDFESRIAASDFIEYVNLYGYYYGTSREWIINQQKQGKHVVLVIDTQGALQLKGRLTAVSIFIKPPSLNILRGRLANRKTETPDMIEKRLDWAKTELKAIPYYDYLIVNDDLQIAYQVLRSIIIAESHRVTPRVTP